MKKPRLALTITSLALSGYTAAMNQTLPTGRMNAAGIIGPCTPDGRDAQACGNAIFNAIAISQIHKGQTLADVRAIMRHDAERHELNGVTESWGYLTS